MTTREFSKLKVGDLVLVKCPVPEECGYSGIYPILSFNFMGSFRYATIKTIPRHSGSLEEKTFTDRTSWVFPYSSSCETFFL